MPLNWTDEIAALGFYRGRLTAAMDLARSWCESGELPAAAIAVGRGDVALRPRFFGRQAPDRPEPLRDDAIFSVASITKPVVAMAAMRLVERGRLSLGEKVADLLPEFAGKGRYGVRVLHLLTHTSGLPDLLPHDRDLRRDNAPLPRFLDNVCQTELTFPPGRGVSYSSCGFVLLGELAARLSGLPLPEFLRREVFDPLGMTDTALGAPSDWFNGATPQADRLAEVRLPEEQSGDDGWNWNSRYWRTLGAPWGGLLSTPADLAAFAATMLRRGRTGDGFLFSPATVAAATTSRLGDFREVPEPDRRCRPWGLGWRLNWPGHGAYFGDLLGPNAYGHWGATGTVLWIDPDREAFAVLLTTQPQDPDGRYLARLSNAIAAARP